MASDPKVVAIYKSSVVVDGDEGFVYSFKPREAEASDDWRRCKSHDIIRIRVPDYFDTAIIQGRMSRSTALDVLIKARVGFDGYSFVDGDLHG